MLSLSLVVAPPRALAQTPEVRAEARDRFDRGLRLFNRGDNSGALAEFERAHALIPHPLVLYNVAMVHVALGEPVAAVEAFDRLLANPGALPKDKLEQARRERDDQRVRIVSLEVSANVEGAIVELDGLEVGTLPLAAPLSVASGRRLLAVYAKGHAPLRKLVTLSGPASRVAFELTPLATELARLTIAVRLPDVQVLVDGEPAGVTPLLAPLALPPGERVIALRRPGYVSFERRVSLGPGSSGELALEPIADATALSREGSELRLSVSEPDAVVFVDERPVPSRAGVLRLPRGAHRLRVERSDFFPFERDIVLESGKRLELAVELEPTPEKRAEYRESAARTRTFGVIGTGAGALIAASAGGFLLWNRGQESNAKRSFERENDRFDPGGDCDPMRGLDSDVCLTALELALEDLEGTRERYKYGFIGLGVGAAVAAAGVTLLLTGEDPDRYEPSAESDVFGRVRLVPVLGSVSGVSALTAF